MFLQLDVDGGLMARRDVDTHPVSSNLLVEWEKQAAQLLLEGFVKVKVNEGVVDVGAFGKERRENETFRSHVPVLLVENEEEGHHSVGGPGNHKTKTDAEEHLEEEVRE